MPVIKSAKKKLRQDIKRQKTNHKLKDLMLRALKKANKSASEKNLKQAVSFIDKSVKKNIIHGNKASRIKSRLSKLGQKIAKTKKK